MVILQGSFALQTDLCFQLTLRQCFVIHWWKRQDPNPIELLFPESVGGHHLEFHHVMSSRENLDFSHRECAPAIGRVPGDLRRGRRVAWTSQPADWTAPPICCSSVFALRFVSSSLSFKPGQVLSISAVTRAIFGHSAFLQCSLSLSMNAYCEASQIGHWTTAYHSFQQSSAGPHFWAHSLRLASLYCNTHHQDFQLVHL